MKSGFFKQKHLQDHATLKTVYIYNTNILKSPICSECYLIVYRLKSMSHRHPCTSKGGNGKQLFNMCFNGTVHNGVHGRPRMSWTHPHRSLLDLLLLRPLHLLSLCEGIFTFFTMEQPIEDIRQRKVLWDGMTRRSQLLITFR